MFSIWRIWIKCAWITRSHTLILAHSYPNHELRYSAILGFQNHSLRCYDLLYYCYVIDGWTINMYIPWQSLTLRFTTVYVFICYAFSELRFLVFKMVTVFIHMFRIIVDVLSVFEISFASIIILFIWSSTRSWRWVPQRIISLSLSNVTIKWIISIRHTDFMSDEQVNSIPMTANVYNEISIKYENVWFLYCFKLKNEHTHHTYRPPANRYALSVEVEWGSSRPSSPFRPVFYTAKNKICIHLCIASWSFNAHANLRYSYLDRNTFIIIFKT